MTKIYNNFLIACSAEEGVRVTRGGLISSILGIGVLFIIVSGLNIAIERLSDSGHILVQEYFVLSKDLFLIERNLQLQALVLTLDFCLLNGVGSKFKSNISLLLNFEVSANLCDVVF